MRAVLSVALAVVFWAGPTSPTALGGEGADNATSMQPGRPARFTDEDQARLDEAIESLQDLHRRLLTREFSAEQIQAMSEQAQGYAREIMALANKKRVWREHLMVNPQERTGDDSADSIGPPTVSRGTFDYAGFFALVKTYAENEERLLAGRPSLAPKAWQDLGSRFEPYTAVAFMPRGDAVAPYILRAALLSGECHLNAAVLYHKEKNRAALLDAHAKGVSLVERVVKLSSLGSEEQLGKLPVAHPDAPDGTYFWAGCFTGNIEDRTQIPSGARARELLSHHCPWGVEVWSFLRDAGIGDLLDFRILRPYNGTSNDKLHEAILRANIPVHIERDAAKFIAGDFDYHGDRVMVNWVVPPKATYSVWFMSPRVYDVSAGQLLSWALKTVKVARGGGLDLLVSETITLCLKHVENQVGSESSVYGACGLVVDANNHALDSDFRLSRDVSFNTFKYFKEILTTAIASYEREEISLLFDTIDPTKLELIRFSGRPTTYNTSRIPPILIRADALGFEKLPDYRYMRQWHMVRYYQFDPRGPTGVDPYDLRNDSIEDTPGEAAYSAGDLQAHVKTWPLMPWQPEPWGYRVYISDFAPRGQILRVKAGGDTLANWKKRLGKGETIVAVLSDPVGKNIAVSEVAGSEVRIHIVNKRIKIENQPLGMEHSGGKSLELLDLCKRYQLRITSAKREGGTLSVSSSSGDFFSTEVDFTGCPGKAFAGKRTHPAPGWVQVDYDIDVPFDIDPKPALSDPFPPVLSVNNVRASGAKIDTEDIRPPEEWYLKASLAPAPPDWVTLTVKVNERTYYLYDKTGRTSSAALLEGEIPLERGENKFTLQTNVPGTRFVFTVKRSDPEKPYDPAEDDESIAEHKTKSAQFARDGKSWGQYSELHSAISSHYGAARDAFAAGQFAVARKYLDAGLALFPQRAAVAASEYKDRQSSLDDTRRHMNEIKMKVAFAQGDGAALAEAGFQFFVADRKHTQENYAPVTASWYNRTAAEVGNFVDRLIMCKADTSSTMKAIALYGELRRLGGNPVDSQYDCRQFLFPQGDSK
ncbi:MAG: hypothetical protein JXP34_14545 [Planctomycetes bacterium]|nr:hypothetical protein [Planctomycetota bacterium]